MMFIFEEESLLAYNSLMNRFGFTPQSNEQFLVEMKEPCIKMGVFLLNYQTFVLILQSRLFIT